MVHPAQAARQFIDPEKGETLHNVIQAGLECIVSLSGETWTGGTSHRTLPLGPVLWPGPGYSIRQGYPTSTRVSGGRRASPEGMTHSPEIVAMRIHTCDGGASVRPQVRHAPERRPEQKAPSRTRVRPPVRQLLASGNHLHRGACRSVPGNS